jgi:dienelactone hydrolase
VTVTIAPADMLERRPVRSCGTGVLVLAGSSGRLERERVELFSRHGARALSIRWFGGVDQRPAPHEVPLETFFSALDLLATDCDPLAVVGTSFGAEAALLTAAHDPRVDAVVAFAPSSVVWAGFSDGDWSSHWTLDGRPLPFVPFTKDWEATDDPPAYRSLYAASLAADSARSEEAAIPVERIDGEVVLVAGGDDQVWPSTDFARMIADRRTQHGRSTTVVVHPAAGHRVQLPGEPRVKEGRAMARGGTPDADAELGRLAWPKLTAALRLS